MYAAVEHGPVLCSDSNILCLSWKGRVPKSEKEKPVCRRRYYEEGWLATGNGRGVVGVTFTSSHCRRDRNTPQRINFNLRGHNSEVCKTPGPSSRDYEMVPEMIGKTDTLHDSWRVYVCAYLQFLYTYTFTREDGLILAHTWRVSQLMKINLRIRWSNLTLLGSGAQGEKYITNGQFSIWSSRVKKVCKKKKKKTCTDQASKIPLWFKAGTKWEGGWGRSVISGIARGHAVAFAL